MHARVRRLDPGLDGEAALHDGGRPVARAVVDEQQRQVADADLVTGLEDLFLDSAAVDVEPVERPLVEGHEGLAFPAHDGVAAAGRLVEDADFALLGAADHDLVVDSEFLGGRPPADHAQGGHGAIIRAMGRKPNPC